MSASFAVSARVKSATAIGARRPEGQQYEIVPQAEAAPSASGISEVSFDLTDRCSAAKFAQEQICGLIQRIFFPGWLRASRQVVISGADEGVETAGVCARIAREMGAGLPGTVCAVEADVQSPGLEALLTSSLAQAVERESSGCLRVDKNLWVAAPETVFSAENDGFSAVWLRTRMSELRRNFDYTLIHAPAAYLTQTIMLGQLADGLILAIQAGKTHRVVAQTRLTNLKAAKVAVLGTVLLDRTFPIPEKLYERL